MIALTRVTFALLLALLLAACGSTPQSKYYRLSATGSGGEGVSPSLGIGPIVIPEYLDRNSMVFVSGDNQLHIASYERWAEPLSHGITRVLGLNLSEALDTQDIRPFPWPASDRPAYAVQVWLLELDAGADQTTLVAEWRLREPGSDREIARRIGRYQSGGSDRDGAAMAAAYSHLLRQLTDDIARALREDMAALENEES
ncbi:membrane integrity-associated transporter subunit PqiC [Parahaliea maris]|uniref:Membrane integrity-associated transporter subunit PqiC n=1 Tax=Parahaliea maris TaxID=2716870 RepID=A0A5C8ZX28_9GAMM|nr:PqiC family protein [Parahaliea maris]TXS92120.1 membrane integrity-associated transporter subunit PqiC [Parahaliea maris]